jgi:hypothetical protein
MALKIVRSKKSPVGEARTLSKFIEEVKRLSPSGSSFNAYRGHRNIEWFPDPGLLRAMHAGMLAHEREAVRELVSVQPQEFKDDAGMLDRLVRMQHFGLPTRLIDVSINPLVALFFATETFRTTRSSGGVRTSVSLDGDVYVYTVPPQQRKYFDSDTVACVANLSNLSPDEKQEIIDASAIDIETFNTKTTAVDRLIQFIKVEKPYFRAQIIRLDLFRQYYVVPKMNNRRIIAQSGAFIIVGLPSDKLPFRDRVPNPITHERIIIPHGAKADIRQELDQIGINERTLFPELDHAASYIARRFN